ncbi:MAG TPA: hypothetical protein VM368_00065 [Flavisolibacter sp.]|nr:hypothetical protein [Flavisolibacter sp.]
MKHKILLAGLLVAGVAVSAQDTTGKRVKITSSFKPVLKEAAKINFNASPPNVDTTKPRLQYNIPNQNLTFAFQPGSLKPLALQVDTGGRWNNESYAKLGFGNFTTPFAQAALSIGDGRTAGLNVYGQHVSSKGKIEYQDFSNTNIDFNAFLKTGNNIEWNARFGALKEKYNKYGFQPKTLTFPEDSLNVSLQTWRARVAFHNINRTELGLSYAPELKVDVFNDQQSNTESNTYINVPVQKSVTDEFAADFAITANLSRYKPEAKTAVNNNFVSISPSLLYKTSNVFLQAGIRPSWNNSAFNLLPNVMAELSSSDKRFAFQLGWVGYFRNSGFRYITEMNPYIWAPDSVYNSRIEERYAGFKGSAGNHLNYSVKAGFNKWNNQPLITNDTADGKSFMVINENEVKVLNFGGEIGFTVGEKFSLISNLQFNQYKPQKNDKAWGLLPLEFRTTMRIQVLKDLYVNGSLYAFDGPWYMTKRNGRASMQGAMDLSAGLEYRVVKNIKVWGQFNNIFNNEYQRWNQYPVYGFNLLGGVVFSFAQNK